MASHTIKGKLAAAVTKPLPVRVRGDRYWGIRLTSGELLWLWADQLRVEQGYLYALLGTGENALQVYGLVPGEWLRFFEAGADTEPTAMGPPPTPPA